MALEISSSCGRDGGCVFGKVLGERPGVRKGLEGREWERIFGLVGGGVG